MINMMIIGDINFFLKKICYAQKKLASFGPVKGMKKFP